MRQSFIQKRALGERALAAVMAAAVGFSCLATNIFGAADADSKNTVIAANSGSAYKDGIRTSWNGDYEIGTVYYDVGELYGHAYHDRDGSGQWTGNWSDSGVDFEYAREGWQIYNVKSYLDKNENGLFDHDESSATQTIANTIPYTTDVNDENANIQEKELMCWQVFASKEANRTRYLERTDIPDFGSPTYLGNQTPAYYIAKGTVTRDGEVLSINWEIRSWVKDSTTYIDPAVFTKTELTGLSDSVTDFENYFSQFSQDDLRTQLGNMWDKADFEGEGSGVTDSLSPYMTSIGVDSWWKAVAANAYIADVEYEGDKRYITRADGTRIYAYDTHITSDGATDILGNHYDAQLDATVSAYQYWPGDNNKYNGSYDANQSDLSGGNAASSVHYSIANIIGQNSVAGDLIRNNKSNDLRNALTETANTFSADTFGHKITATRSVGDKDLSVQFSGSEIDTFITKYINHYYADSVGENDVKYFYDTADSKYKLTLSKTAIGKLFDICETLGRTPYLPQTKDFYTGAVHTFISGDTDYFRKFTRNGVKYSGLMELIIDYCEAKGGSFIFNDTDSEIAAGLDVDPNTDDGRAQINSVKHVGFESDVSNLTFKFKNLSESKNTRDNVLSATAFDLTWALAGFVNLAQANGDKVRMSEQVYFTKGYQRAGGSLTARRNSENVLETIASTTDANTNEPKMGVAKNNAVITDVVEYRNLTPGTRYCIVGALYDADSKGAITKTASGSNPAIDTSATDVIHFVGETYTDPTYVVGVKYFTPTEKNGSLTMTFTYDARSLAGKTITVCDKLYIANTGTEIFSHNADKNLATQSISIKTPALATLAKTPADTKTLAIETEARINDTVQYVGLIPNQEYTLIATVYDKTANALVVGAIGTLDFKPDKADGTVVVPVTINTVGFNNKELVVYEELYLKGTTTLVASHKDKTDESQTVTVVNPAIRTVAADYSNKSKDLICSENAVILDNVTYSGLILGEQYTLSASIYDKDADTPVWRDAVATKTFTADATGEVSINITIDTSDLKGHHIVVGETIYKGTDVVVSHKDVADTDQTVSVESPWITTVATAADGTSKKLDVETSAIVIDRVSYGNLVVNKTYYLLTQLVDKTTNAVIADNIVTNFTTTAATGTVDVNIPNINTTNRIGHELVVYQYLSETPINQQPVGQYIGNPDSINTDTSDIKWLVTHTSLTDANQTVTVKVPTMSTQAQNVADASVNAAVTDTLTYSNLKPSTAYNVHISLYDVTDGNYDLSGKTPLSFHTADDATLRAESVYTFTSSNTGSGSANIIGKINLDTISLLGTASQKKVVIVEQLALANGDVAFGERHIDTTGAQTFTVNAPSISTVAQAADETKFIDCASSAVIVDKVSYTNLSRNTQYTLLTKVWNQTKSVYLPETKTTTFTTGDSMNGSVDDISLTVNTSALKDSDTLIVVQILSEGSTQIIEHFDTTGSQTVNVKNPGINTTATANDGESKNIDALDDAVVLDAVSYDSLVPGKTYTLVGAVYDRTAYETDETETRVSDLSVNTFTPETAAGTVNVSFTFDARNYKGHKLVVREWLYEGTVTADNYSSATVFLRHDGFAVDSQTVTVKSPSISTLATAVGSTSHDIDCGTAVTVTDKIFFRDFPTSGTYTVVTGLYDNTSKSWVNETLATNTFDASTITNGDASSDGTGITITVNLDTKALADHSLVFVETIKHNDKVIAVHDDKTDAKQTVKVKVPSVGTVAKDKDTNTNILSYTSSSVIVDTVAYTNLIPGKQYTLLAKVWDKSESKFLDVDTTKTFTPSSANGSVDVEITVNTLSMPSETLVVFEYLSLDGTTIAKHDNPDDEDQTVTVAVPGIRTTAIDRATGEHTGAFGITSIIDDTVHYEGLVPGKTYVLTAKLYNKATQEEIECETAPVSFTPEAASGDQVVSLSFNSMELGNVDVVVFEKLTLGDDTIAIHEDINDADQTVTYVMPTIDTVATADDGESKTVACASSTLILDKISYTGLEAGVEYTVTTTVYDKTANNRIIAQDSVTKTVVTADGEFTVNIAVNTTDLKGHQLVIGEVITKNDVTIVAHEDMSDTDQTVSVDVPNIRTNAKSKATNTQTMEASVSAVIVDRVTYSGLTVGKKYTVTATPYNKQTGKPISVTPVTVEFTPTGSNGYIDVEVPVDTTKLVGQSVVMFESLKQNGVEIAVHNDINDEDQTVTVMSIRTLATAGDGSKKVLDKKTACKVIDKISYTGLTVGETYVISGQLVDKTNAESVVATSSIEFKPTTADGVVEMTFTFDTTNMASKSFVAFETITQKSNNVVVGEHKDINDLDQTVTVVDDVVPPPEYPQTGDSSNGMFNMCMAFFMFFAAIAIIGFKRRRGADR